MHSADGCCNTQTERKIWLSPAALSGSGPSSLLFLTYVSRKLFIQGHNTIYSQIKCLFSSFWELKRKIKAQTQNTCFSKQKIFLLLNLKVKWKKSILCTAVTYNQSHWNKCTEVHKWIENYIPLLLLRYVTSNFRITYWSFIIKS